MSAKLRYALWAGIAAAVTLAVATASWAEPAYVGAKTCKKCHIKQYKSWQETRMANAFELLKPGERAEAKQKAGLDPDKDYTTDEKCLGCHVTGYKKPGGYGSGASPDGDKSAEEVNERMRGVGCEMCHGPGGDFLRDDRHSTKNKHFKSAELAKYGFINKPQKEQCEHCHNENSPFFKEFNFEERKAQGTHEHFELRYEH